MPTQTASAGEVACGLLFDKGENGRLVRASSFLANLPGQLDASHVTVATINANDLEHVAGKADDEMKPLIDDLIQPLKAVAPGSNKVDASSFQTTEEKVVDRCEAQSADYDQDKATASASVRKIADEAAAKEKKAAADAAKKAADEAAAKAAAEAAAAPKEYAGFGDDVVTITKHGTGPQVAVITHSSGSNFAVHTLDATMDTTDLLVNTIGSYSGAVLFDAMEREQTTGLKITAGGSWTVKLVPLASIRSFDGSAPMTGVGDDVFRYTGAAKAATFSHDGSSNIAVHNYGTRRNLLINEIGAYTGTVVWAPGVYTVTADGNWSATLK